MRGVVGSLLGYALLSVIIVGSGAAYDKNGATIANALADSALLFAILALFLSVLRTRIGIPAQIFVAMLVGILAGWVLRIAGKTAFITDYVGIFGELFLLLLKMVIVPLVFVSVLLGVAGLGDVRRLGSLGAKTITYFLSRTAVAVIIGLVVVNVIRPGDRVSPELRSRFTSEVAAPKDASQPVQEMSTGMVIQKKVLPGFLQSPVRTDEYGVNILAIIVFALFLGAALASQAEKARTALAVFQAIDSAMVTLVMWIMVLAPLGVFALMAKAIATLGLDYLSGLAIYVLTVLLGLVLHFGFLVFIMLQFVGGVSPLKYLRGMAPAIELAFTTSSSSATLPVSIQCATERVGINRGVVRFVLPLGATVNMDGTALYTSVASLFVAEFYGIELGIQQQIMVFLTAVIVSIGTVGVPGASLAMMTIIFTSVNIPLEGIGLVVGVDRLLDMCRTVVNITGDSVGAAVIARTETIPESEVATT